jgi:CheY-like chemotaxis protein
MKKRVLLMDDQQMLREVTSLMLKSMGYEVAVAENGDVAVSLYRQAMADGRKFDLVILDLVIPGGIGGKEVVDILRRLDPTLKAIVSSGYTSDPAVQNYTRYGFDESLPKPYGFIDLRDKLHSMLNPPTELH